MANKGGGGEGAFMAVSLGLSANETVHPIKGRGTPLADGFCGVFRTFPFYHCLIEVVRRPSGACSFIGFVINNGWMGLGWSC